MKKSSVLPAVLFLLGMIVGGAAVFFFVKPQQDPGVHISEPIPSDEAETAQSLQEAEEIPPQPDLGVPIDEESIPPTGE